jgi:putative ABC transport system permease protein
LAITVLFAGNIAGLYPSLILSKLSPSKVLKGQYIVGQRYRIIGLLVTFQFIGTSTLMIGSVGMYQQLSLLQNKELGFEKSAVIRLEVPFRPSENIYQQLRTQLSHFAQIENVTASWQLFGNEREGVGYQLLSWQVGEKNIEAYDLGVGPHFLETTKIKLIEGRSLSDWTEEPPHQILVNESFVKAMGWQDPLGKPIDHKFIFKTSEIVGVVEDFHFLSLHQPIRPLIIHPQSYYTNIYARVSSANLTSIIDIIEQKWKTVVPDIPFVYHFMDKDIALQYKNERRWTKVITYITAMAVLVACLGLIGMGSLLTQQRTKEIGIRKVLGASIGNLMLLLSRDYFKLIFAAFLIGTPVGNFLITEWLQNFAYRIQINGWIFVIPVLSILLIAVLSIGSLTYTAANKNPVDSLKYE